MAGFFIGITAILINIRYISQVSTYKSGQQERTNSVHISWSHSFRLLCIRELTVGDIGFPLHIADTTSLNFQNVLPAYFQLPFSSYINDEATVIESYLET